jgi:hypothetical protein
MLEDAALRRYELLAITENPNAIVIAADRIEIELVIVINGRFFAQALKHGVRILEIALIIGIPVNRAGSSGVFLYGDVHHHNLQKKEYISRGDYSSIFDRWFASNLLEIYFL